MAAERGSPTEQAKIPDTTTTPDTIQAQVQATGMLLRVTPAPAQVQAQATETDTTTDMATTTDTTGGTGCPHRHTYQPQGILFDVIEARIAELNFINNKRKTYVYVKWGCNG